MNPDSRLNFSIVLGAGVFTSFLKVTSIDPKYPYSVTTNNTDIDPVFGGLIAYQINSKFALKLMGFYDYFVDNPSINARLVPAFLVRRCLVKQNTV